MQLVLCHWICLTLAASSFLLLEAALAALCLLLKSSFSQMLWPRCSFQSRVYSVHSAGLLSRRARALSVCRALPSVSVHE